MKKHNTVIILMSVLLWVLAGCATASKPQNPTVVSSTTHATVLDAVATAGKQYNPPSIADNVEYLGAVFKTATGYRYTAVRGHNHSQRITVTIKVPRGTTSVAYWHTHGRPRALSEYFSPADGDLVQDTGKPLYLVDPNYHIRVLRPGYRTGKQRGPLFGSGYAEGELVGTIRAD